MTAVRLFIESVAGSSEPIKFCLNIGSSKWLWVSWVIATTGKVAPRFRSSYLEVVRVSYMPSACCVKRDQRSLRIGLATSLCPALHYLQCIMDSSDLFGYWPWPSGIGTGARPSFSRNGPSAGHDDMMTMMMMKIVRGFEGALAAHPCSREGADKTTILWCIFKGGGHKHPPDKRPPDSSPLKIVTQDRSP